MSDIPALIASLREDGKDCDGVHPLLAKTASLERSAADALERLQAWVNDLQSGMYINCVYCGHRYGPRESTPVSMADVLKAHIEQCPQHPMSALKAEIERLQGEVERLKHYADTCGGSDNDGRCPMKYLLASPDEQAERTTRANPRDREPLAGGGSTPSDAADLTRLRARLEAAELQLEALGFTRKPP